MKLNSQWNLHWSKYGISGTYRVPIGYLIGIGQVPDIKHIGYPIGGVVVPKFGHLSGTYRVSIGYISGNDILSFFSNYLFFIGHLSLIYRVQYIIEYRVQYISVYWAPIIHISGIAYCFISGTVCLYISGGFFLLSGTYRCLFILYIYIFHFLIPEIIIFFGLL